MPNSNSITQINSISSPRTFYYNANSRKKVTMIEYNTTSTYSGEFRLYGYSYYPIIYETGSTSISNFTKYVNYSDIYFGAFYFQNGARGKYYYAYDSTTLYYITDTYGWG